MGLVPCPEYGWPHPRHRGEQAGHPGQDAVTPSTNPTFTALESACDLSWQNSPFFHLHSDFRNRQTRCTHVG